MQFLNVREGVRKNAETDWQIPHAMVEQVEAEVTRLVRGSIEQAAFGPVIEVLTGCAEALAEMPTGVCQAGTDSTCCALAVGKGSIDLTVCHALEVVDEAVNRAGFKQQTDRLFNIKPEVQDAGGWGAAVACLDKMRPGLLPVQVSAACILARPAGTAGALLFHRLTGARRLVAPPADDAVPVGDLRAALGDRGGGRRRCGVGDPGCGRFHVWMPPHHFVCQLAANLPHSPWQGGLSFCAVPHKKTGAGNARAGAFLEQTLELRAFVGAQALKALVVAVCKGLLPASRRGVHLRNK